MTNVQPLTGNVESIPIDSIIEPEFRLRVAYDEDKLLELADSLEEEGMFYPLLVKDLFDGTYELVVGSRRLRAAKLKGYVDIPSNIISPRNAAHALQITLTENLQRDDLDPFEEARGFLYLMHEHQMTHTEICRRLKVSPNFVSRRLALLGLPDSVQEDIASGKLGLQYAPVLIKLTQGEKQVYYAKKAIDGKLSLPELQAVIAEESENEPPVQVRRLTPEKVVAKILVQKNWFRKFPNKLNFAHLSPDEKRSILDEVEDLRAILRDVKKDLADDRSSLSSEPASHGEEWTIKEINAITAEDRPSDEVLSKRLGRTPGAISSMRSKMK